MLWVYKTGNQLYGEKYTMEEWIQLCLYEKTGRRIQLAERNNLKALMDKVKDLTNQLISEGVFSIKRLQDRYQEKKNDAMSMPVRSFFLLRLKSRRYLISMPINLCRGNVYSPL